MSDNITPKRRKEAFLDDIAGGSNDLTPKTREEYYLKQIAEQGGGSSLPTYTSADAGKVLTVDSEGTDVEWQAQDSWYLLAESDDDWRLYSSADTGRTTPLTYADVLGDNYLKSIIVCIEYQHTVAAFIMAIPNGGATQCAFKCTVCDFIPTSTPPSGFIDSFLAQAASVNSTIEPTKETAGWEVAI